jgi:hypothetical protein
MAHDFVDMLMEGDCPTNGRSGTCMMHRVISWPSATNQPGGRKHCGSENTKSVIFWTIRIHFGALTFPNSCFCCYRVFLSTFSYVFYPRPESATFLLATVVARLASRAFLEYDPTVAKCTPKSTIESD